MASEDGAIIVLAEVWGGSRPLVGTKVRLTMARTTKRQKVATVESALFNPDVVFLLASLLDARDLCQMALTCKTLGGKQGNGLSFVEEASRRQFECATVWERSCLPKYDDEGWIELYHHLLMLRSKLTFDQLVGRSNIQYGTVDKATVSTKTNSWLMCSALCSNHVMRAGRHFALFAALTRGEQIGVIRPIQTDLDGDPDDVFVIGEHSVYMGGLIAEPMFPQFFEYLMAKRTERWGDSDVHFCKVDTYGQFWWCDWTSELKRGNRNDVFQDSLPIGLLLDLNEGTLSMYQNGQRLATLKDGLAGEYCWFGAVWRGDASISIHRASASDEC